MSQTTNTTSSYRAGPAWTATAATTQPRTGGLLPAGPSCQPCPACGGLQCLCRPRFFAGQLLTEQDLNRLEQYVIAKNQLHNRYLVGHGVVCGLEVSCSPCGDTVGVSPGYAIDTCGNDVIVCSADTVDICRLINACTPATPDCSPYKDLSVCKDGEQTWILAIRYQESPSRGITPLTGPSRCACGGGGGCSCGCGGAVKTASACGCGSGAPAGSCCGQTIAPVPPISSKTPRRGAPFECEPTITCEGYVYEVFPAPPELQKPREPVRGVAGLASQLGGELFARITCCIQQLMAALPTKPSTTPAQDPTGWSNYCCALRQALIQFSLTHPERDCQALARLRGVACPSPKLDPQTFVLEVERSIEALLLIFIEFGLQCICSALLPPCPAAGDPRVPLAAVTVRVSDCAVISICDWTPLRKHVVTTKTLGYWLGWLPFAPMLRTFLEDLCCRTFSLREQLTPPDQQADTQILAAQARTSAATGGTEPFDQPVILSSQAYQASNPLAEAIVANLARPPAGVSVGDLVSAAFDTVDPSQAKTLETSPHIQVLAEIARPLMESFAPLFRAASANAGGGDVAGLRAEVETLKATLDRQQAALDELRQTRPPA